MTAEEAVTRLKGEGFAKVYVWKDAPFSTYATHTHQSASAHIIISGEITIEMDGSAKTYKRGDRIDVPAGKPHSARIGPKGCVYVIGE